MESGSNFGDGNNGGNYIGGSDMPTNNVDLVDQYCRDISGWAVTQRSQVGYTYHCLNYLKEVKPDWTPITIENITERVQIYAKKPG